MTKISVSPYIWLRNNLLWPISFSGKIALGRAKRSQEAKLKLEETKQYGPLTDADVEEVTSRQIDAIGQSAGDRIKSAIVDDLILTRPVEMQHKGAKLLKRVLEENPEIRSVANVGARIDLVSPYLAAKFPDIEFTSVDFQPNLANYHIGLPRSKNWLFKSGYALRLFEAGELAPGLVFMTGTSTLFNNKELDAYLDVIARRSKMIVLNESWWPSYDLFHPGLTKPEYIPESDPYCRGPHGNYHHNYIAKLERRKYRIVSSYILEGSSFGAFCLQIVAKKATSTPQ